MTVDIKKANRGILIIYLHFNQLKGNKMAIKSTYSAKPKDINKDWFIVDAEGLVLGRLAVIIANRLRGKHKVSFTPHMACGDNLIVINCEKVVLTGNKRSQKTYYWHTGYPGGIKETTPVKMKEKNKSHEIIKLAIKRMIPSGPLGKQQLSNCKIYRDSNHKHEAQSPRIIDIALMNRKNTL